jgi:hypothetical protein
VVLGSVVLEINSSITSTCAISVNESTVAANSSLVGIPALGRFLEITSPCLAGNMNSVTMKLYYNDSDLTGIDESTLRLYYYNATSNAWEKFDSPVGGVDMPANYVWAITNHFSNYGAFGSAPASSPASTGGGGGAGCVYDWRCTDWVPCLPDGTQSRTCTDEGTCGSGYNPPALTQTCTYTAPLAPTVTTPETPAETPAGITGGGEGITGNILGAGQGNGVTGMLTSEEAAPYAVGVFVIIAAIVVGILLQRHRKKIAAMK